uniref:Uncharacterized protein n=1 Tax=Triticum aestivum TaxID=4565 RepID=A0A077S532_WHEAT|nr:unnamed protein product [Triticum aestivum]
MIHPKKLAQLAKKLQRLVAAGVPAKPNTSSDIRRSSLKTTVLSTVADKGHCVVYTADGARFEVPLAYLNTTVFAELLRMAGEEFGFASSEGGRITLPCNAAVMDYVLCLVRRDASEEVERAFLSSIVGHCHGQDASGQDASMGLAHQFALCT